jgi:lipoprotein-anchoring transpeptidase ErfK/SrfK
MIIKRVSLAALAALALAGCKDGGGDAQAKGAQAREADNDPGRAVVAWDRRAARMTPEEMERARLDESWMQVVQLDPITGGPNERPNPEKWEQISIQSVNTAPQHVPLYGDVGGPSVLRIQVMLDRALFSPGIMDGRWGKNTAQALYWFQKREGLPATARADSATFERLRSASGSPAELVVRRTLSAEDVEGPFTKIPEDVYEHAKLDCSCYESLTEKLSEMFHITPDLLAKLNPGVQIDGLKAGQTVNVPAVRDENAAGRGQQVAKLIISGRGTYVHAVDASGRVIYHFPSTLGGKYSPSPTGSYRVTNVTQDPSWHYQPDILVGVPDDEPDAMIPKGPNVAVGTVWMALSEPHFGIHGTAEPQTIGYASSNGCVRLTNWDVEFLSRHIKPNTPVEFRDITGQKQAEDPANAESSSSASARGNSSRSAPAAAARPPTGTSSGRSGEASGRTPTRREGSTTPSRADTASRSGTTRERARTDSGARSRPTTTEPAKQEEHAGHTPR